MKELIRMYKASNGVLEKANIWSHIEEKVEELSIEHNPDDYAGSLYYDEEDAYRLNLERNAYKRGFMQAIQMLEFD
jgi:hypothetical protein